MRSILILTLFLFAWAIFLQKTYAQTTASTATLTPVPSGTAIYERSGYMWNDVNDDGYATISTTSGVTLFDSPDTTLSAGHYGMNLWSYAPGPDGTFQTSTQKVLVGTSLTDTNGYYDIQAPVSAFIYPDKAIEFIVPTCSIVSANGTPPSIPSGHTLLTSGQDVPINDPAQNITGVSTSYGFYCPQASPTTIPVTTTLAFTVYLADIGQYGDNANPLSTSLSNQSPQHTKRPFTVNIYDNTNTLIATASGTINYDSTNGYFTSTIPVDSLPTGDYSIKASSPGYLVRLFSPILHIQSGTTTQVPPNNLIAGDINEDNQLDILDYNILLDCGYGAITPLPMSDPASEYNSPVCQSHQFHANADLNDDGIIDANDYNLFTRELSVQQGD